MSFMIGCGGGYTDGKPALMTPKYFNTQASIELNLAKGEQHTLTKEVLKAKVGNTYKYNDVKRRRLYISLNYRFFSEGSTLWLLENGDFSKSVILGYIWRSEDKLRFLYKGSSKELSSSIASDRMQYPLKGYNVGASVLLSVKGISAYAEKDMLEVSFSEDFLNDTNSTFSLVFKRGDKGGDDYFNTRGNSLYAKGEYNSYDNLTAPNFVIPKSKRNVEFIIGDWSDTLANKRFRAQTTSLGGSGFLQGTITLTPAENSTGGRGAYKTSVWVYKKILTL
ncbi:hypothetical protein VB002_00670 [Campylobacter concisus]